MKRSHNTIRATAAAAAAVMLSLTFALGEAQAAEQKTYVMKIGLPTLRDTVNQVADNIAAAVTKESAGRIKAEVYPASQLGPIPRMIEGTQFGAIQCVLIPPEFFVGVDERFEMMAAPGLVSTMQQGQRVAADPAVQKLMFDLGASKGLHGAGLFMATPSQVISKVAIHHLDDFRGKKLRIFASEFQFQALKRLGATPVAMTLGDVLPALQQGAIDGAIAALNVYVPMHFQDAAKYVTETNQPAIFIIAEVSHKWRDSLPQDLQQLVDRVIARETVAIDKSASDFVETMRKSWVEHGGELIQLPPEENEKMLSTLGSVGHDVTKNKPGLAAAYKVVTDAAARTHATQ